VSGSGFEPEWKRATEGSKGEREGTNGTDGTDLSEEETERLFGNVWRKVSNVDVRGLLENKAKES
jgi:hypothetical protein